MWPCVTYILVDGVFSSNLKVGCAGRLVTSLELLLSCDLIALLTARLQEATPWLRRIFL
jgi:hypothetical protein